MVTFISGEAKPDAMAALSREHAGHMDARGFADADVLPSGRKTRALLAITALAAPRPALRGRIADTL
jgi:hypothetical protein